MQKKINRRKAQPKESVSNLSVNFEIAHLDSLGQGVFKRDGEVFFIKKTLPGETGDATFLAKQKGVHFFKLNTLKTLSPLRQDSPCPHFNECGGCDYLHTTYELELKFKLESLQRMMQKIARTKQEIEILSAPKRFNYRNRIQLHYSKDKKLLGFLNLKRELFAIPHCLMMNEEVQIQFNNLIENQAWLKLVEKESNSGHIEIYQEKIAINKAYSDGGFTQVFEEMNLKLKADIKTWIQEKNISNINLVDLFGGAGNLSNDLNFSHKLIVDYYKNPPKNSEQQTFIHCDLYDQNAIKSLQKIKTEKRLLQTDLLIIDPPRSGLKNIHEYLQLFLPKYVIYVSCQATSLARDLQNLPGSYQIEKIKLVDLFPATHHFETVAFLVRKDCESTFN